MAIFCYLFCSPTSYFVSYLCGIYPPQYAIIFSRIHHFQSLHKPFSVVIQHHNNENKQTNKRFKNKSNFPKMTMNTGKATLSYVMLSCSLFSHSFQYLIQTFHLHCSPSLTLQFQPLFNCSALSSLHFGRSSVLQVRLLGTIQAI